MKRNGDSRRWLGWLGVLSMAWAVGCGGSGDNKPVAAVSNGSNQAAEVASADPTAPAQAESGPAAAAREFLEAARTGNDAKVTAMLTPVARQERAKHGLKGAPSRSDTARFELGQVTFVGDSVARVASTWTDKNRETQQMEGKELTWFLRRESEGWRIGGVSTIVFEGEPPLLLDFEKPLETIEKLQMLYDEINRREQAASKGADKMANTPGNAAKR